MPDTAAGPLLDELSESRPEDARWLRDRIGALAVANYAAAPEAPVVVRRVRTEALPNRTIRPDSWESFSKDVLGHFWFDLHTLESTLASLNDSLRYRAGYSVAIY